MRTASIRWRLPLSYAGIALVATLVLGLVLITTLRSYYADREFDYLTDNAYAISTLAADFDLLALPADALEMRLNNIAFLTQTRMRLLDSHEAIINDTGSPNDVNLLDIGYDPLRIYPDSGSVNTIALSDSSTAPVVEAVPAQSTADITASIITIPMPPSYQGERNDDLIVPSVIRIERASPTQAEGATNHRFWIGTQPGKHEEERSFLPATRALFGFNFGPGQRPQNPQDGLRSDQMVQVDIRDKDGVLQGYVQLSEGPAYGEEIVAGVAEAWLLSSLVAISLAVIVGLVISQRISAPLVALKEITVRMTGGELSARAQVTGQDEVGILAGSFNEMANRVEETITTLRRFVADAAHELHTPLTALRTNLELIGNESDVMSRELFLERAQAQVMRLETLTTDLLELSRLESGIQQTDKGLQEIDITALIYETSEFYASRAEQAGLDFALELPAEPICATINASQVRRALDNLLGNALKFTPQGGTVTIGLSQHSTYIELWVRDNGIGIPDDDLPQLFSRFHRGRNAFNFSGSGLGLAIVKAIADYHNGQVIAENLSPGAKLSLRFPV